jgi:hypothetical protein
MDVNKDTPAHIEDGGFDRDWRDQKFTTTQEAAHDRAISEADLTPLQAIKAYPMAIFWSLMVSMCVIMEGYDTILIGWLCRCIIHELRLIPWQVTSLPTRHFNENMATTWASRNRLLLAIKFQPHGKQVSARPLVSVLSSVF